MGKKKKERKVFGFGFFLPPSTSLGSCLGNRTGNLQDFATSNLLNTPIIVKIDQEAASSKCPALKVTIYKDLVPLK